VPLRAFPSSSLMQNCVVPVLLSVKVGPTVICAVAWELKYPVFDALAVIVMFVVLAKLGAVKVAV
jgi:hypothetical protein